MIVRTDVTYYNMWVFFLNIYICINPLQRYKPNRSFRGISFSYVNLFHLVDYRGLSYTSIVFPFTHKHKPYNKQSHQTNIPIVRKRIDSLLHILNNHDTISTVCNDNDHACETTKTKITSDGIKVLYKTQYRF